MKFSIENLGPIKKADIELGDLTIICGKNSTGKTYITYSLIAFLSHINQYQFSFDIGEKQIQEIKEQGEVFFNINEYKEKFKKNVEKEDQYFNNIYLPVSLSIKHKNEHMSCKLSDKDISNFFFPLSMMISWHITATTHLKASFPKKDIIKLQLINKDKNYPSDETIKNSISNIINDFFIKRFFNLSNFTSFTCERTGVALFGADLIAADFIKKTDKDSYKKVVFNEPSSYQLPVRTEIMDNIDFSYLHIDSLIARKFPQILELLEEIVKGKYIYDDTIKQMMFIPEGTTDVKLTMHQSSSTVRSLRSFDYFLRHKIQPHQTIVMDEPELNLHPENQRKLARLFAMLVNIGIKVIINTHSDYIIKEFNTLLMLNNKKNPRNLKLQQYYGYSPQELLDAKKVKLYCVENGIAKNVPVTQDFGMTIESFDESIREMGIIQRDILYGGEE